MRAKEIDRFKVAEYIGFTTNDWGKNEFTLKLEDGNELVLSPAEMGQLASNEVKVGRITTDDSGRLIVDIVGREYDVKHIDKEKDFGNGMKQFVVNYFNEVVPDQQA